ncbi:hypothetical protein ACLK1T_20780 [Escherichia coli]
MFVSSAGYDSQRTATVAAPCNPTSVTLKLDKASYAHRDPVELHIASQTAGKGYAMVGSGGGPLWSHKIDVQGSRAGFRDSGR